jgi:hypothetical protein
MTAARYRGRFLEHAIPKLTRAFCVTVGLLLLLEDGTLGLIFSGTDFSVSDHPPHKGWNFFFEFNSWHHLLHVATGALLLAAALRREWAPTGAFVFGAIYVLMAPLGFIDGDDVLNIVYSGARENTVHAVLAVAGVSLGIAPRLFAIWSGPPPPPTRSFENERRSASKMIP